MIRRARLLLSAVLLVALSAAAPGSSQPVTVDVAQKGVLFDRIVRDRANAMADQLTLMDGADLVAEWVAFDASTDLTPVQIDAVFFDLVSRLRALGPGQVGPDALTYLKDRPVRAVRRHEESSRHLVPLFNVAAAVRGLENQWAWTEGFEAVRVPGTFAVADVLQRYATDPELPFARGVRAALPSASTIMLDKLAGAAVDEGLFDHFIPYLWLARLQLDELGNWLPVGSPRRVADVLRLAAVSLDANHFRILGQAMLSHPDAGSRAMTLALLTDQYLAKGAWSSDWAGQLWMLIEDPDVSSTAALQLARLGAAEHWQANPASAPANALDSAALERIQALEQSLTSTRRGVR